MTSREELLEMAQRAIAEVCDPEIPNLSITDLGIVRSLDELDGIIVVTITPTYSGCPAMHKIERDIRDALRSAGVLKFRIEKTLSPAWTTEWITETGRRKLSESGIAPPTPVVHSHPALLDLAPPQVICPLCGSAKSVVISEFGSTPCKAFYRCTECLSTFEYFKPI